MSELEFTISIPTDEGFLGRECNNPQCHRYFRVYSDSVLPKMFCPYCGTEFLNDQLYTPDQLKYIQEQTEEKAKEYVYGEIDKIFGNLAQQSSGNRYVRIEHSPIRYHAKQVSPQYNEPKVDSELICPKCSFRFQVYGIFGYCPGCRSENMLIYDANLSIIRREIEDSSNPTRALRHAYGDLVSTFQLFCARKATPESAKKPSFQELFPTRKFFKDSLNIDIFSGLTDSEMLSIRRIFQKRHVCEHNGGIVTEQYVQKIPEDRVLINTHVQLSIEEFEIGAKSLRKILDNLVEGSESR